MSALVAGVRAAAGHPAGPEIAADTGLATRAGHQPSGRRSSPKQRTVNPPIVPTRCNFLLGHDYRPADADQQPGWPPVMLASTSEGSGEQPLQEVQHPGWPLHYQVGLGQKRWWGFGRAHRHP